VQRVIKLNRKQDVILKFIRDGKSQRQIIKETGICRETIRKYIKAYESELSKVDDSLGEVGKIDIIEDKHLNLNINLLLELKKL
jgi:DNA invertase Pin-like site-specific DNA recombinase